MNKKEAHVVQGMTRDTYVSQFNPTMVCDARNIRITSMGKNRSLLSVTNEKGPAEFDVDGEIVTGTIIGYSALNNILTLFTTQNGTDRIYKLTFNRTDYTSAVSTCLFEGSLGFDEEHPIEALSVFENEDIQKVYWVDGINQPRMINIATDTQYTNNDIFNFNRKIEGKHTLKVTKYNTGGVFPAGTVQYCFNYFNKFGQETNIVDASPLYYLSPKDRGLPADAMSTASFIINIDNVDPAYEYVRVYSIIRTSENASPNVRIIGDYKISSVLVAGDAELVETDAYVPLSDLYILDLDTNERTLLTDKYPEGNFSNQDIPLRASEYLYDNSNGKIYCLWRIDHGGNLEDSKQPFIRVSKAGTWDIHHSLEYPYKLVVQELGESDTNEVVVVDNGIVGSTIDAQSLLFLGGQKIVAGTLTNKGETLFLGNIKQDVPNIGTLKVYDSEEHELGTVKQLVRHTAESCTFGPLGEDRDPNDQANTYDPDLVSTNAFYDYPIDNNKSSYDTKGFKARENYRLGIIAQYNTGQWSEALWIDDVDEEYAPGRMSFCLTGQGGQYGYERSWEPVYKKPGFKATIPEEVVIALKSAGFIRIAPVVVYPQESERKVLYQGLLAGTVYNVDDRNTNSPFVQADWRFRVGYNDCVVNGEIQANTFNGAPYYPYAYKGTIGGIGNTVSAEDFIAWYPNQYYRDSSILTFHSPDVEFSDDVLQSNLVGLRMRIVGLSNLGFSLDGIENEYSAVAPAITADSYLEVSTQGFNVDYSRTFDFASFQKVEENPRNIFQRNDHVGDLAFVGFADSSIQELVENDEYKGIVAINPDNKNNIYRWITYLWHRSGSLNDQPALSDKALSYGSIRYGMLKRKCVSEIRYARTTFFQHNAPFGPEKIDLEITTPALFDSEILGISKIETSDGKGTIYYGNIDKIVLPNFKDVAQVHCLIAPTGHVDASNISTYGYPIEYESVTDYATADTTNTNTNTGRPQGNTAGYLIGRLSGSQYGKDPILMRYKSTRHIVLALNNYLSKINHLAEVPAAAYPAFWRGNSDVDRVDVLDGVLDSLNSGDYGNTFDIDSIRENSIYIAELYRDFTQEQLRGRFGGSTDEAIVNNVWNRCGESEYLEGDSDIVLYYREGDTYVGRYDCLKTYPFTDEDPNQIVSIYSTEIESRVNLDERYDKNRGLASNMYARPTNFNQLNRSGYEQSNQFFTYKAIDYDRYGFDDYPNLITWSLEKKMGADIDAWTSMYMLSTADMDGKLGEVTKLATFNDTLFGFQPRGVAQILFNERVQIPTSDGQPIEITNGMKYGGIRYLSNQIGLTNKWSFTETPLGMYFVDDEKDTLYYFNGQQFQDLSTKAGFRTWLKQNNSYVKWNPKTFGNFRTYYDKVNSDIYFMTKDESLVYSEQLGTFTSFMDYAKLSALVNINDNLLTFTKNSQTNVNKTWKLFSGNYNIFFGTYKPYWLTFISNSDPTIDKVFNNVSWRTVDYFNTSLQPTKTFDSIRVWNDHQDTGTVSLVDNINKPSILKKKFNVFRVQIPRDKLGDWKGKGLNRIRNPWAYIQLSRSTPNTDYMTFQDMEVDFFE